MNSIPLIWTMVAAGSLTLAVTQFVVWTFHPARRDSLAFCLMAGSTAAMAFVEIQMMTATTTAGYSAAQRWQHVPVLASFVGTVAFIHFHLQTGRLWLGMLAVAVRTISLVANFTTGENMNYLKVTGLRKVDFLGDQATVPLGPQNPMMIIGQVGLLLLLAFVTDGAVRAWRRGYRLRSLLAGWSVVLFVLLGTLQAILSHWRVIDAPAVAGLYFSGTIITMAAGLSIDALRADRLEAELQSTQESRAREVAHLGRVAALGELSTSLAHEMNQPLGIILSNAQAAQRLLAQDPPDIEEVREILEDIVKEDRRAAEVIRRMRALLKRGGQTLQQVDLNGLIEEVVHLTRAMLAERETSAEFLPASELPKIPADRVQLQQVLLNLIMNGCDATESSPPGRRRLSISTSLEGGMVRVSVADNGRGLTEDLEQIFQPFFTTKENGLGMGLAICRSIASSHNGQLWAEPNPAGGAIFHLLLPAKGGST